VVKGDRGETHRARERERVCVCEKREEGRNVEISSLEWTHHQLAVKRKKTARAD
jgi:hypothetical protein